MTPHGLADSSFIDLFNAEIVLPPNATARMRTYAALLTRESEKRCRVLWRPGNGSSRILLLVDDAKGDEGFSIAASGSEVRITGHSERGLLFGIGQLLRNIEFSLGRARLPVNRASVTSVPRYPLRGHQLGYRPKTNSYDGWNVADWHQYICDLAVFGTNTIEILPPHTDDDDVSPHFPLPPEQMMVEVSRLADLYGLDVWMWYPAMDGYDSVDQWAAVFQKLPRLDAVFTPGGDPGDMPPGALLALLEKQKQNLHRYHPRSQMWVSPQSFGEKDLDEFFRLANDAPWLDGVVHGPQCRVSLPELRRKLRASLPIRLYPDITHSLQCQFPVPDWDRAFAATEGRECINPRPEGHAAIARQYLPHSIGFISYSEGCNDDMNKFIWSSAAWNPEFSVQTCLLEYARYFIGVERAQAFAGGIARLERNWIGSARTNAAPGQTLAHFRELERNADPFMLRNWRFQQALYRAYFDDYSHRRLLGYVEIESRSRVTELGEALFQSIHMQLNVERYQAESVERGANLDTLDASLTGPRHKFDIGQGSYYDDLGDPHNRPHLVMETLTEPDPEFRKSVLIGFLYPDSLGDRYPVVWKRWGETLFDTALKLHYANLDHNAKYKLRVVYSGDARRPRVRLSANGAEIHGLMPKPWPPQPLEFEVPRELTEAGAITFAWTRETGLGGSGRGCQISEVWLIRQ